MGAQISLGCEETAQPQWVKTFRTNSMKQIGGGRGEQSSYIRPEEPSLTLCSHLNDSEIKNIGPKRLTDTVCLSLPVPESVIV